MAPAPDLSKLSAFILRRCAPVGTERIDDGTPLVESGWIDSFAIVEVVAFLASSG